MSNYSVLKQDINNNIYENQTQQITGTVLNAILNEMTASLGAGYQFAGVATLGMNPGDPDQRVFYLAGEGIYTSFGGIQVPAGKLGVLKWDNRWTLQTIDGLGGGGANLTGYVSVASTDDLPDEGVATLGYLCGENLYLYVGEGGDTKEGKYQDCGSFRGPQGDSVQDVEQTQTSLENGGVNKIKFTLSNGVSCEFQVRNGTTSSGLFPTLAALQAAYPSPVVGQYAFVGAGFPADIYVCTTAGTWTDSGEDYDGDNVDLTDYATKAEVNQLEAKVDDVVIGMGQLVVSLFKKSAFLSNDAETDINALESLLSGSISRIEAEYTQSGTIYVGQSLDDLKPDLVVMAYYLDGTSDIIDAYTLSGTLTAGTSTITVAFGVVTTTFTVSVTAALYYRPGSEIIRPYFLSSTNTNYGPAVVDGVTLVYTRSKNSSNVLQVSRACYPYFDLELTKGTNYKWMVKLGGLPAGSKIDVALQYHNQSFKTDGLANQLASHASDIMDSGWLTATISDGVLSFTYGSETASSALTLIGARLNLRLLDSSNNDIAWPDASHIDALIIQTV